MAGATLARCGDWSVVGRRRAQAVGSVVAGPAAPPSVCERDALSRVHEVLLLSFVVDVDL